MCRLIHCAAFYLHTYLVRLIVHAVDPTPRVRTRAFAHTTVAKLHSVKLFTCSGV
jgi:hypothetical protein